MPNKKMYASKQEKEKLAEDMELVATWIITTQFRLPMRSYHTAKQRLGLIKNVIGIKED